MRTIVLMLAIVSVLCVAPVFAQEFSLNRIRFPDGKALYYIRERSAGDPVAIRYDERNHQVLSSRANAMANGRYDLVIRTDDQGRMLEDRQQARTLRFSYANSGTSVQFVFGDATGRSLSCQEMFSDARTLCFLAGGFPLYLNGQEATARVTPPQDPAKGQETADYASYLKVKDDLWLTVPAGTFRTMEIEFGFTGVASFFAPKVRLWIDRNSRVTVKLQVGNEEPMVLSEIR